MKVLLYLKRNEQSEKDMCPLMGRISIKGRYNSTAQFSCKKKVSDVPLKQLDMMFIEEYDPFFHLNGLRLHMRI